jgi:outer membrane protein assembly factor BamB
MPSADLFLRLLEEKELVSPEVLQAARREAQKSPQPQDAVRISLWLVQGQHITASQAERLLTAASEQAEAPKPKPLGSRPLPPRPPEPKHSQAPVADNPELDLLPDEATPRPIRPGPAKLHAAAKERQEAGPAVKPPAAEPGKKPSAEKTESATKNVPTAKIGGELESLDGGMKGPLDALVESEASEANPFDDSASGPQLHTPTRRKFKLSRFIRNLFRRNKSKVVKVTAANPRQVKLVLFSWGVAIMLLLGLLTAFWAFSPPGSTELLEKAEQAMAADDFGLAIRTYDQYLKYYGDGPDSRDARLLRSLAELRQAEKNARASNSWAPAVDVAKTLVKELPKEYRDLEAMKSFGVTLAKIGEGLAQQMQAHPDMASVERVQSIIDMLETDVPENGRPTKMIEEVRAILKRSKQEVEGRRELDQAIDAIGTAVKDNDPQAAYTAYRGLVQMYPERTEDVRLIDAMKQVSSAKRKAIKVGQQSLAAVNQDRPTCVLVSMPLAVQPVKGELAAARGKVFYVVEQGTVFGLDASTGKTLWRRFLALDLKLSAPSVLPIEGSSGGDVVACDPVHQELLRLRGTTGELVWRLAVKQPIVTAPVQMGSELLLLTQDRRLNRIDVATGNSNRFFPLLQPVRLPPVADAARGLVFLAADHSNLIVLDAEECRQVLHVGYEAGKVAAAPAIVGDFLFLPMNDPSGEAAIRIFLISKDKNNEPLRPVQSVRVPGSVDTTPVALGRGIAVVTAQGGLFVIDRNASGNLPFEVIASRPIVGTEKSTHYVLSDGAKCWLADWQLTRYAVHIEDHRIIPQALSDLGMRFVQSPRIENGAMFQVLQRSGMPGLTISAFDPDKNEPIWQTWLGAPLVAEPVLGVSGNLTAATASGGVFRGLPGEIKPRAKPWEPVVSIGTGALLKPLSSLMALPGEIFAITGGAGTKGIVIYNPKEQDKQFRWLRSTHEMSAPPGFFAGGLLTACVNGQVFLLDLQAQGDMAKPLEPSLAGVTNWDWRTPVAIDSSMAVLSDGDKRLTTITISKDADKALTEVAAKVTKTVLVSPIAVLGKLVFVVDSTGTLLSFDLPGLTPGPSQVVGARCIWGPQRVGKLALLATETNRLFAVGEQGQVVWQSMLDHGPLAGAPFLAGDEIYLSSRSGVVWRISTADGKERGKIETGDSLGSGPLVIGSRLIVGSHDGSLLEVKKP